MKDIYLDTGSCVSVDSVNKYDSSVDCNFRLM